MTPLYRRHQSSRPLRIDGFVATRRDDPERGPLVRMNANEAIARMLTDGELVIIEGPRGQQFATLAIDDTLPRGSVVVRDIVGVAPSEIVHVTKPDLDAPPTVGVRA